jgi:ferredoxin
MCAQIVRESGQAPVFACVPLLAEQKGHYDKGRVIAVGCLGRLEESELVTLLSSGVTALQLAHAHCQNCDLAAGRTVAQAVWETMDALLATWARPNPIAISEGLPQQVVLERGAAAQTEDIDGVSRREFFTQFKNRMTAAASQTVVQTLQNEQQAVGQTEPSLVKVTADGTLPHFIPSRRERMLDHLALLGEPAQEYLDCRLWGYMQIDAGLCNSCRMCATFCPTGAIAKFDDPGAGGESGVEHYPADCVQCRLCEDICPSKALSIASRVPVRQLLEGTIIRFAMQPPAHKLNDPKQIYHAMYDLLGGGQIYER